MDLGNMTLEDILNLNPELEKRLKELALQQSNIIKEDLDDSGLKVNLETGEENPNLVYDSPKRSANQITPLPPVEIRVVE